MNDTLPIIAGIEITTDNDGRFNLNALHRASTLGDSKKPSHWLGTQMARELTAELEAEIPATELINFVGGAPRLVESYGEDFLVDMDFHIREHFAAKRVLEG